jgi:hypothetical protein
VTICVEIASNITAGYSYADGVRLFRMANATLIADGAITTNKIIATGISAAVLTSGTITADRIGAGSITAGKISVTTLAAINANIGAITAGSLTIGGTPAISGTTMTGNGTILGTDGRFAFGNASTNLTFNGTVLTLNGQIVDNGSIVDGAVRAIGGANISGSYLAWTNTGGMYNNTEQTALSVTVDTGNTPVLILCSWVISANGNEASIQARTYRGSTLMRSVAAVTTPPRGKEVFNSFVAAPGSGSVTYTLKFYFGAAFPVGATLNVMASGDYNYTTYLSVIGSRR